MTMTNDVSEHAFITKHQTDIHNIRCMNLNVRPGIMHYISNSSNNSSNDTSYFLYTLIQVKIQAISYIQ